MRRVYIIRAICLVCLIITILQPINLFIGKNDVVSNDVVNELKSNTLNLSQKNLETLGYEHRGSNSNDMEILFGTPDDTEYGSICVLIEDENINLSSVQVKKVNRNKGYFKEYHRYDLYIECDSVRIIAVAYTKEVTHGYLEEYVLSLINQE